jgi:hypothetical protein
MSDVTPDWLAQMDLAALPDGSVFVTDVRQARGETDIRAARVELPSMDIEHLETGVDDTPLSRKEVYHKLAVSLPSDHASLPYPLIDGFTADTAASAPETDGVADEPAETAQNGAEQPPLVESKEPVAALSDAFAKHGYSVSTLNRQGDTIEYEVYHDDFSKVKALGGESDVASYNGETNEIAVEDVGELIQEARHA